MKYRDLILLFLLEVLILFGITFIQKTPGYMDSEYYTVTGKLIAEGRGSQEPFIWNYLDDPVQLPHTSFTYWMPFPALLAALGFKLFGSGVFFPSRIFFILLSGFIPVLTYMISYRLTSQRADAILAGLLGAFSGFYFVFLSIPESLLIYLLGGGILFLLLFDLSKIAAPTRKVLVGSILIGCIVGIMHLSRADGVIWVVGSIIFLPILLRNKNVSVRVIIESLLLFLIGYFLVMGAWYLRNIEVFGALFPPGNGKTLWITNYNQLFSYPSSAISFSVWWNLGLPGHLQIYFDSLVTNLKNMFAIEGLVFLFPLIIIGIVKSSKGLIFRFLLAMYALNVLLMTFIFPLAGMRGGFIHSTAAFQIVFWALVPIGLTSIFTWMKKKRNWDLKRSTRLFYPAITILAAIITVLVFITRVYGNDIKQNTWDLPETQFASIEQKLMELGTEKSEVIITKDPPGYYLVTGRPAIAMPDGDINTLLALSNQFGAKYLILDKDHVTGLNALFDSAKSTNDLELITILPDNIQIYKISSPPIY